MLVDLSSNPPNPSAHTGMRNKTVDERPLPRTLPATQTVRRTAAQYEDVTSQLG